MACANINIVRLIHSERNFSRSEVERGRISRDDCFLDPDEVKRWSIADEAVARAELAKHLCTYEYRRGTVWADVWALEFFEADEDGEFVNGGDLDYAPEEFSGDRAYTVAIDDDRLVLVETVDV